MNNFANVLNWTDEQIPHRLWIEKQEDETTRLCMKIVKDTEPEMLYLKLDASQTCILNAWQGGAFPITEAYDDGRVYSQVRSLLNLPTGCVLWSLTHVLLPDGKKISTDKLGFIPNMHQKNGHLMPV
ncbi:hypothetical protein [Vibrio rotiferianus]|uniref:hypothetical protein n=1 Tax=Vibrio rotiferianus TaxID=190895 RepID=UPI000B59F70A|nr:hypothetical protein [Vibrio rotiferianus]ASI95145.1 hypothetical protein BSZ04_03900 [Vibrio rotiferianus]